MQSNAFGKWQLLPSTCKELEFSLLYLGKWQFIEQKYIYFLHDYGSVALCISWFSKRQKHVHCSIFVYLFICCIHVKKKDFRGLLHIHQSVAGHLWKLINKLHKNFLHSASLTTCIFVTHLSVLKVFHIIVEPQFLNSSFFKQINWQTTF